MKKIGKLHILTDTILQTRYTHLELAGLAIAGGADTIQFRQKEGSTREMICVAEEMQGLCRRAGVAFLVNDRVQRFGRSDNAAPEIRILLAKLADFIKCDFDLLSVFAPNIVKRARI